LSSNESWRFQRFVSNSSFTNLRNWHGYYDADDNGNDNNDDAMMVMMVLIDEDGSNYYYHDYLRTYTHCLTADWLKETGCIMIFP
jgi:hypothetical protein